MTLYIMCITSKYECMKTRVKRNYMYFRSKMGEEATNIRYYLRERRHAVQDEASENESDHEEIEEHVSGFQKK